MVAWIWTGGILMAFGTVLALFPGRRRRATDPASALPGLDRTGLEPSLAADIDGSESTPTSMGEVGDRSGEPLEDAGV